MTNQEAQDRAAKLGLSTWMVQAIAVGETSHSVDLMCVGFASIEMPLAEAETWEEALDQASRIIFGA